MATRQNESQSELARRLGVSRQRVWAMKKAAEGNCMVCGKPAVTSGRCLKHHIQVIKYQRKRLGFKPWQKGKPGRPPIYKEVK